MVDSHESKYITLLPDPTIAENLDMLKEAIMLLGHVDHKIPEKMGELPAVLEKTNTYLTIYIDPLSQKLTHFELDPEENELRRRIQEKVDHINSGVHE